MRSPVETPAVAPAEPSKERSAVAGIASIASALPERRVSSAEIGARLGLDADWVVVADRHQRAPPCRAGRDACRPGRDRGRARDRGRRRRGGRPRPGPRRHLHCGRACADGGAVGCRADRCRSRRDDRHRRCVHRLRFRPRPRRGSDRVGPCRTGAGHRRGADEQRARPRRSPYRRPLRRWRGRRRRQRRRPPVRSDRSFCAQTPPRRD